ncbi:MAG: recombinase family protein [Clostridiales bacterium]|nr:recombinase family protein [Clostridiales bacterium]
MVAIYARQSVDKGEQSLSIGSQIEECQKRLHGSTDFKVYEDKGFTGANTNRPGFIQMMDDVKSGRIVKVIVWKLDRISRSLLDFASIVAIFNQNNVGFDSVIDNFDTSTPMGRAMLNIVMVFAQLERETIQLRIIANYQKRAEKGFFLGGRAIFGLEKIPITVDGYKTSTYRLDPVYGSTLLEMFYIYANTDATLRRIAMDFNERGVLNNNGTMWESQKLSRILSSPTYVQGDTDIYEFYKNRGVIVLSDVEEFKGNGLYLYGKRESHERKYTDVKDHKLVVALHEGVIDSQTWLKVQYKLAENKQFGKRHGGKSSWLIGLMKCAKCGYAITGSQSGKYTTLRCSRRMNFGDCDGLTCLHADNLEAQIWQEILKKVEELRSVQIEQQGDSDIRINQLRINLIKIEEKINNLVKAIADGGEVSAKILSDEIAGLDEQRNEIKRQMQQITVETTRINTDTVLNLINGDLDFEEKRAIAKALIKKIQIVDKNQPVKLEWLF